MKINYGIITATLTEEELLAIKKLLEIMNVESLMDKMIKHGISIDSYNLKNIKENLDNAFYRKGL